MLKKLLTVVLPIVLPFLVYWIGLQIVRWRRAAGGEVADWERAPWFFLTLASGILLIASLLFFRFTSGVEPGTVINPPSLVDGVVKPAHQAE